MKLIVGKYYEDIKCENFKDNETNRKINNYDGFRKSRL